MVILASGPRKEDWTRAHKECAIGDADVLEQPSNLAELESVQKVEPLRAVITSASRPVVEPITGAGSMRYRVALSGRTIFVTQNKSRAEGAAELAEQLIKDGSLTI